VSGRGWSTQGLTLIISGYASSWGVAPDSIGSGRKGTALPHIRRHSRSQHFFTASSAR